MLDPQQTVADLVLDHSECAAVFKRHQIDFCCRGDLSIRAACERGGVELDALLDDLSQAIAERSGGSAGFDARTLTTGALLSHIITTHHDPLRQALPFVEAVATKVGRVHGAHNPKLRTLAEHVGELCETLLPHLDSEEQQLFPSLEKGNTDAAQLQRSLAEMYSEHLAVGALLASIRGDTDDFQLPEWACNSYRTLFAELEALEDDLTKHIHLENHVLMPRFISGLA